jgi:type III secretory pathway component EscV
MKKYLMFLIVAIGITGAGFAQTTNKKEVHEKKEKSGQHEMKEKDEKEERESGNQHNMQKHIVVPMAVKNAFTQAYPGTTAKWEKEDGNYESNFKHSGHEMSALFNAEGALEETEMEIKINELPAEVSTYVKANREGMSIKEASKITKANGDINYEAEVNGRDMIFDSKGNFLK